MLLQLRKPKLKLGPELEGRLLTLKGVKADDRVEAALLARLIRARGVTQDGNGEDNLHGHHLLGTNPNHARLETPGRSATKHVMNS